MGKIRDLFEKIRDTNGTFHTKMGTIKDRNCMDLTESEDIDSGLFDFSVVISPCSLIFHITDKKTK